MQRRRANTQRENGTHAVGYRCCIGRCMTNMMLSFARMLCVVLMLGVRPAVASAEPASPEPASPEVVAKTHQSGQNQAEVIDALKRVSDFYRGLPAWSVHISCSVLIVTPGEVGRRRIGASPGRYAIRRPSKFALNFNYTIPSWKTSVMSDGKEIAYVNNFEERSGDGYVLRPGIRYMLDKAKPEFESMSYESLGAKLATPPMLPVTYSILAGLADGTWQSNPFVVFDTDKCDIISFGKGDDAVSKTVRYRGDTEFIYLTIANGKQPWITRIVVDAGAATEHRKAHNLSVLPSFLYDTFNLETVEFSGWMTEVDDSIFTFVPPPGSRKLDGSLFADIEPALKLAANKDFQGEVADKLTAFAPAGQLKLSNNTTTSLDDLRCNEVLVLDFWASWCGPCLASLPILEKIAKEFEGKGVKVIAVNISDTPEKAKAAFEKHGITLPIGFDIDNALAKSYEVKTIPRTFIIGRDGKIADILSGASPDLEQDLRAAFEKALQQPK